MIRLISFSTHARPRGVAVSLPAAMSRFLHHHHHRGAGASLIAYARNPSNSASSAAALSMIQTPSSSSLALPSHSHSHIFMRHSHDNRHVSSTGVNSGRVSRTGSVLNGRMGGGHGLFDVDEDELPAKTRAGRVKQKVADGSRYIFVGVLMVVMAGGAFNLGVFYLANPEEEVRKRTTHILSSHPTALKIIGSPMLDVTLRTRGSRALQAFHRYPYFGAHPVEMEYVLQGKKGKAAVFVQYLKDGHDWKLTYLHLDSNHGRSILLDSRGRA